MSSNFLFPFEMIPKDSRIALYGAGNVGKKYYEQVMQSNYCFLVCWIDIKASEYNTIEGENKYVLPADAPYEDVDYVVIAIEDIRIKNEVIRSLKGLVCKKKIVWRNVAGKRLDISDEFNNRKNKLRIEGLIGDYKETIKKKPSRNDAILEGAIKVRIFYEGVYFWNCFKSIATAYNEDKRYDILVVGCTNDCYMAERQKNEVGKVQLPFVSCVNYDITADCPDIAIVGILTHGINAQIRYYSKYVVAIHGGIIKSAKTGIEGYWENAVDQIGVKNPDVYITDKLLYEQSKEVNIVKDKLVPLGNPKFDDIYSIVKSDINFPKSWKKLEGKKVVLWATDHNYLKWCVSFDDYARFIFDYFRKETDLALILRPHGSYFGELVKGGIWTSRERNILKHYINDSPNVVLDERALYDCAYKRCDAILTDVACGIICSSLPLNVPVGGLMRLDGTSMITEEKIKESLYVINSYDDLMGFFDMIKEGNDPKRDVRNKAMEECVSHFDGKNGYRIKRYIQEKIEPKGSS